MRELGRSSLVVKLMMAVLFHACYYLSITLASQTRALKQRLPLKIVAETMLCFAKGILTRFGGERACNSHRGEMLVVTKNRTKCVGGWQGSCAVCVDLQAVGALGFFGELYSLAKGYGGVGGWGGGFYF